MMPNPSSPGTGRALSTAAANCSTARKASPAPSAEAGAIAAQASVSTIPHTRFVPGPATDTRLAQPGRRNRCGSISTAPPGQWDPADRQQDRRDQPG